jgi:hypothetical protein
MSFVSFSEIFTAIVYRGIFTDAAAQKLNNCRSCHVTDRFSIETVSPMARLQSRDINKLNCGLSANENIMFVRNIFHNHTSRARSRLWGAAAKKSISNTPQTVLLSFIHSMAKNVGTNFCAQCPPRFILLSSRPVCQSGLKLVTGGLNKMNV